MEDAESHAFSDEEANRISLIRSLIRWLEDGELPGPDVIQYLERQLGGIRRRRADPHEVTYHHRPHSGLGYRTPKEVRETWEDAQESGASTDARGLG